MLPPSPTSVHAEECDISSYRLITDEEYYPENYIGYVYPVRPGTPEWAALPDHQAMVDACTIPEDILANMTTEELAHTILAYPLIGDMFAYDSYYTGLDVVEKHFNGLTEFSVRSDNTSSLVDLYSEQEHVEIAYLDNATVSALASDNPAYALEIDYSITRSLLTSMILATLLTHNTYATHMTANDLTILSTAASERAALANQGIIYAPEAISLITISNNTQATSSYSFDYHVGYDVCATGSSAISITGGGVTLYTTACVETWMCSDKIVRPLPDRIYSDIPTEYKTTLNNYYYDVYGINPVSAPTVKYNCHSYAWYQQSTSNPYWIDDPRAYLVTRSKKNEDAASVGNRIIYFSPDTGAVHNLAHSGVVISITTSSNRRSFTIKSKWGMSGLYEHSLNRCPYYYYTVNNTAYVNEYAFY